MNKWFALQAMIEDEGAVERVERLMAAPRLSPGPTPTASAPSSAPSRQNLLGFHRRDGAGYRLLADKVLELDRTNPQVAARLIAALRPLAPLRRGPPGPDARRARRASPAPPGLSRDSYEIASKSLA